jgi:hypothetical protein
MICLLRALNAIEEDKGGLPPMLETRFKVTDSFGLME